jgi:hypothetical protein
VQGDAVRVDYTHTVPLQRAQDAVKASELLIVESPTPTPAWKRQAAGVPLSPLYVRGTQTLRTGFRELAVDVPAASGPKAIGVTVLFYKIVSQQVQQQQQIYARLGGLQ